MIKKLYKHDIYKNETLTLLVLYAVFLHWTVNILKQMNIFFEQHPYIVLIILLFSFTVPLSLSSRKLSLYSHTFVSLLYISGALAFGIDNTYIGIIIVILGISYSVICVWSFMIIVFPLLNIKSKLYKYDNYIVTFKHIESMDSENVTITSERIDSKEIKISFRIYIYALIIAIIPYFILYFISNNPPPISLCIIIINCLLILAWAYLCDRYICSRLDDVFKLEWKNIILCILFICVLSIASIIAGISIIYVFAIPIAFIVSILPFVNKYLTIIRLDSDDIKVDENYTRVERRYFNHLLETNHNPRLLFIESPIKKFKLLEDEIETLRKKHNYISYENCSNEDILNKFHLSLFKYVKFYMIGINLSFILSLSKKYFAIYLMTIKSNILLVVGLLFSNLIHQYAKIDLKEYSYYNNYNESINNTMLHLVIDPIEEFDNKSTKFENVIVIETIT